MSVTSSAYISCIVSGQTYTYHFTGVTEIEHNLALNLNNASAQGTDIINGARNLPAPDQWVISIWDHAAGERLVNMIPLVCSRAGLNDLLAPFRFLREGKGLGSLFCLRNNDNPSSTDPTEKNLKNFQALWSDSI